MLALWVTNRERHRRFIDAELLPAWGLRHVTTWHWLKVTDDGQLVSPLVLLCTASSLHEIAASVEKHARTETARSLSWDTKASGMKQISRLGGFGVQHDCSSGHQISSLLCRRPHTGGRTRCCCFASPCLLPPRRQLFNRRMQQNLNIQRSLLSKMATVLRSPASLCGT